MGETGNLGTNVSLLTLGRSQKIVPTVVELVQLVELLMLFSLLAIWNLIILHCSWVSRLLPHFICNTKGLIVVYNSRRKLIEVFNKC